MVQQVLNIDFQLITRESDVVCTPEWVSEGIIKHLNPIGVCLDPCRGEGAFYKYMPEGSKYCELREGTDFFKFNEKVDWIIGNPPYSIFEEFLRHGFHLAENVSYLVPTNKIFQRQLIMEMINEYGGIKSIIVYGSGSQIDFPFEFSVGNFHFQRGYKGLCEVIMGMKEILGIKNK